MWENEVDRFAIRDREAGNIINVVTSIEDARKTIREYEEQDKIENVYEENFYEIYDLLEEQIV